MRETRKQRVLQLRDAISEKLDEIAALYKDDVKVTLIVRVPGHPDGSRDTTMMSDDPKQAIAALCRLLEDPASEYYPADIGNVPDPRRQLGGHRE